MNEQEGRYGGGIATMRANLRSFLAERRRLSRINGAAKQLCLGTRPRSRALGNVKPESSKGSRKRWTLSRVLVLVLISKLRIVHSGEVDNGELETNA